MKHGDDLTQEDARLGFVTLRPLSSLVDATALVSAIRRYVVVGWSRACSY